MLKILIRSLYVSSEKMKSQDFLSGKPPYLENLENLEFCHLLLQAWKMHRICSKSGRKPWNFNSKYGKNLKFVNLVFQNSLSKMSFTKETIDIFVISIL